MYQEASVHHKIKKNYIYTFKCIVIIDATVVGRANVESGGMVTDA